MIVLEMLVVEQLIPLVEYRTVAMSMWLLQYHHPTMTLGAVEHMNMSHESRGVHDCWFV